MDVNVDSLTDNDLKWADMAFIGGMAVQRKSASQIIARCHASNLKVVAGGPLFTSEAQTDISGNNFINLRSSLPSNMRTISLLRRAAFGSRAEMKS